MPNFTQPEFDNLTIDDLLKNVFTIDSNGRVCMRVLMIGQNIINWGQIGGTLTAQSDLNTALSDLTTNANSRILSSVINAANGVAGLGADGKLSTSLLPSIVFNDVKVVADIAARDAISMTDRQGLIVKVVDRGDGKPSNYMWDIETTAWIMFADVSDVTSVNGYTGVINLTIADIPNLQTDLNNRVWRTGNVAETITGVKTFGSMPIFSAGGQIVMNTGHYIFDAPIANQARIWSSNASAGLWIGAFTGGISLNNTVYVTEGNRLEVGSNNTSNYTRLLVLGNSDTTRMIEWGDGGVVWAGFGRTTTNEQYMDVSNYGGKDFEMRGKYWFRRGLHSTQITDADSRQVRIGSRWDISNIAHSATGHILQFLWGDNASAAEGSGTDGGWGLEFGAHGNPYMKMIATDTTIGRTDGYVSVFGSGFHVANGNVLRVYQAASSNHLAIWNNGTYNRLEAVGGQAINIVGTGKLLVIGDDAAIYDVNIANAIAIKGEQNSNIGRLQLGASAYIQGNADGTLTLQGYTPPTPSNSALTTGMGVANTSSQSTASSYGWTSSSVSIPNGGVCIAGITYIYNSGSPHPTPTIQWSANNSTWSTLATLNPGNTALCDMVAIAPPGYVRYTCGANGYNAGHYFTVQIL